jgi:hypothetical protein
MASGRLSAAFGRILTGFKAEEKDLAMCDTLALLRAARKNRTCPRNWLGGELGWGGASEADIGCVKSVEQVGVERGIFVVRGFSRDGAIAVKAFELGSDTAGFSFEMRGAGTILGSGIRRV